MLTSIQSAGVAPEVNLRITQARKHARDPPWLWNPGQTSLEVQNREISGPKKRTYLCPQKILKKKSCRLFPISSSFKFVNQSNVKSKVSRCIKTTSPPAWMQEAYRPFCIKYSSAVPSPGVPSSSPTQGVPILTWLGYPPRVWTDKQTENSTFPHPSDAGGKKRHLHQGIQTGPCWCGWIVFIVGVDPWVDNFLSAKFCCVQSCLFSKPQQVPLLNEYLKRYLCIFCIFDSPYR